MVKAASKTATQEVVVEEKIEVGGSLKTTAPKKKAWLSKNLFTIVIGIVAFLLGFAIGHITII
jgi:hypothetical protein